MNVSTDGFALVLARPGAERRAAVSLRADVLRENQMRLGLWMFLATVTMLFASFASAYIVRRAGSDWRHITLPSILWLNTLVLAASSLMLEAAKDAGAAGRWTRASAMCGMGLLLGVAFVAGQALAWRQLTAAGVYLPSTPHSSFFYMLSGAHAVHVVAALVVLAWGLKITRSGSLDARRWVARFELCRTFWHYLGAVWIGLFALVTLL